MKNKGKTVELNGCTIKWTKKVSPWELKHGQEFIGNFYYKKDALIWAKINGTKTTKTTKTKKTKKKKA